MEPDLWYKLHGFSNVKLSSAVKVMTGALVHFNWSKSLIYSLIVSLHRKRKGSSFIVRTLWIWWLPIWLCQDSGVVFTWSMTPMEGEYHWRCNHCCVGGMRNENYLKEKTLLSSNNGLHQSGRKWLVIFKMMDS